MGETPIRETGRYVAAVVILGAAAAGLVPDAVGLLAGSAVATLAASSTLARRRELARRRRAADRLLAQLPGPRVPERLTWRATELTAASHRRHLERLVRRLARMAGEQMLITTVPVSTSTLRPNRVLLESVAARMGELDRPVSPRGVVLLEELLRDSARSPLYRMESAPELARALARVQRAIDTH